MFTVIMARNLLPKTPDNLDVFLRLSGVIVFEALVFVNFTHGLEIIFTGSHEMHIPQFFIIVTIVDVVVKTTLLLTSAFPTLGLDWRRRILLHYTTTSMTLILVALNRLKTEQVDYLSQLDPYCGLFASLVLTIIVVPTTCELLSYFLANKPESFRVDDFIIEIEQQVGKNK